MLQFYPSEDYFHASRSGRETRIDNVPSHDIIQEKAFAFTEQGEVVMGSHKPSLGRTANCLGVYYGNGRGPDA